MLGISQTELAAAAAVSRQTVVDFERGARTPYPNNLTAIRAALEAAGVEFIPENGGGAGVRLKRGAYTVQAAPGGSDPDDLKAGKAEV
ncbi:putative transcriptional regulator [Gluconacetobacter sacchari DSM 12717]|uniref:Helix-turn-helix transcriptional regulator n=2 Tax=Gluconacetobacter sacchari TaxID=92759 RepID=A0A7W4IBR6_9PROT|nr:helix-turn-helix transcriptional regulator [Gluconacetobacter sacchari]MBB2159951.1 helix-turn-helix transcriptional regulator [Gluconacetobacter sacchari]GBQ27134.1 putative transcriptional regulator [Gluconacetobacter sacchari DSM 12717]